MQLLHRRIRATACLLAVTFTVFACSVSKTQRTYRDAGLNARSARIVGITTVDGKEVLFDKPGAQLRGDSLVARIRGTPYAISVNQIAEVSISRRELSAIATFGGVLATIGVPLLIPAILIWASGGL